MPDDFGNSFAAPADLDTSDASARKPAATLALATSEGEADWDHIVTLDRAGDGHFYADVSVDGQSTRMLVDTGASVIALTGADAEALGLVWNEDEIAMVARGANGPVMGVHATLANVTLGGFEAADVPALIIPEGLSISLLGQSFLSQVRKVEISGDNMVMTG